MSFERLYPINAQGTGYFSLTQTSELEAENKDKKNNFKNSSIETLKKLEVEKAQQYHNQIHGMSGRVVSLEQMNAVDQSKKYLMAISAEIDSRLEAKLIEEKSEYQSFLDVLKAVSHNRSSEAYGTYSDLAQTQLQQVKRIETEIKDRESKVRGRPPVIAPSAINASFSSEDSEPSSELDESFDYQASDLSSNLNESFSSEDSGSSSSDLSDAKSPERMSLNKSNAIELDNIGNDIHRATYSLIANSRSRSASIGTRSSSDRSIIDHLELDNAVDKSDSGEVAFPQAERAESIAPTSPNILGLSPIVAPSTPMEVDDPKAGEVVFREAENPGSFAPIFPMSPTSEPGPSSRASSTPEGEAAIFSHIYGPPRNYEYHGTPGYVSPTTYAPPLRAQLTAFSENVPGINLQQALASPSPSPSSPIERPDEPKASEVAFTAAERPESTAPASPMSNTPGLSPIFSPSSTPDIEGETKISSQQYGHRWKRRVTPTCWKYNVTPEYSPYKPPYSSAELKEISENKPEISLQQVLVDLPINFNELNEVTCNVKQVTTPKEGKENSLNHMATVTPSTNKFVDNSSANMANDLQTKAQHQLYREPATNRAVERVRVM